MQRQAADRAHESFPYFDWLRFALASAVALYHERIIPWDQAGNFAVQVFFALSGWLIGGILLRSDRRSLPRFYFNRATRIWIPYVIAVAVLYLVAAVRESVTRAFLECLTYDLTFTHNYFINPVVMAMPLKGTGNHFWSISVEEQFYLAAPLLLVFLPFGRSIILWAFLAAAAMASQFWYGSIALGVLAAIVRCRFGDWHFSRAGFAAVAVAGLALTTVMIAVPEAYVWVAPPLAASIILALSWSGKRSPVGEFVGGVSYPLYLYHWVGLFAATYIGHWIWMPAAAGYFLAVLCGIGAYVVVDRNVMHWRGYFYGPALGGVLMATAYCVFAIGLLAAVAFGKLW
jgi:peptidoglycan/LPS O-acetylase OafA/YrhL